MVKKITTELVASNAQALAHLEIGEAEHGLAAYLEVDMQSDIDMQIARIRQDAKDGLKTALRMGLRLLAVKAECEHGEFAQRLNEAEVGAREAQHCMQAARAYAAEGDLRRREALLDMGRTKGMAILAATPAIREQIMNSPELLAEALEGTTREFEAKLAELQASNADLAADRDAIAAERDGALRRLNKRNQRDEDEGGVPLVMADIRSEIAALVKKAELAIDSFTPLGVELVGYRGHDEAGVWVEPTGRLAIAGLLALRLLADGAIKRYAEALDLDYAAFEGKPEALAFLAPAEILAVAQEWPVLAAVHGHEAALRQHEREQAKPKGKGRPAAAPKAPKA